MMRQLFFLLVMLIGARSVIAQYYFYNDRYYDAPVLLELGVSGGVMNCLTDVGGKGGAGNRGIMDINWSAGNAAMSVFASAFFRQLVSVRLEFTKGAVEGADSTLKPFASTSTGRYERNLSFHSRVNEFQLSIEFHFLNLIASVGRLSPYLCGGVGIFSFNPRAKLKGKWHALQPLRTEGQGMARGSPRPYSLIQSCFPMGLGMRYEIGRLLAARLELGYRVLQTDFLDDVSGIYPDPSLFNRYLGAAEAFFARQLSDRRGELNPAITGSPGDQRGNPGNNDAWFSILLKFSITLGRKRL